MLRIQIHRIYIPNLGLFEEGNGCQRVILGGEVGYTKVREFAEALYEEGRGQ